MTEQHGMSIRGSRPVQATREGYSWWRIERHFTDGRVTGTTAVPGLERDEYGSRDEAEAEIRAHPAVYGPLLEVGE